jgi:hypothetical protein
MRFFGNVNVYALCVFNCSRLADFFSVHNLILHTYAAGSSLLSQSHSKENGSLPNICISSRSLGLNAQPFDISKPAR